MVLVAHSEGLKLATRLAPRVLFVRSAANVFVIGPTLRRPSVISTSNATYVRKTAQGSIGSKLQCLPLSGKVALKSLSFCV